MSLKSMHRSTGHRASCLAAAALLASAAFLTAQTHKVARPENVVRAVGVYEWTGDMAKPTASRIVPISLFIDGKLQDAGIYLARPVPFALLTGNIYELDQAGVPKGTVDLLYSRHFEPTDTATVPFDDGWFGYGTFVPPAAPKKSTLKPAKTLATINGLDDDSKPHFSSKSATPGSGGSASTVPGTPAATDTPPADPDRPTMKRHTDTDSSASSTSSTASADSSSTPAADPDRPTMKRHTDPDTSSDSSTTPAADPDRPTMKRHSDTSDQTASSGSSPSGDTPADDPDRPTLRRRSPEEAKKTAKAKDESNVRDVGGSLNDDPDRPNLHRGKPLGAPSEKDFPRLLGLPGGQELHQMVAVSDAANRPPHDFSRPWSDEAEHQTILATMQKTARAELAAYAGTQAKPAAPPAPDTRHPNSKLRKAATPDAPAPPPEPLLEEQLKAFTLSYGGAPTYVYTAHTAGLGAAQRFVTLVAQVDMQGTPQIAMKSVTDAAHLDRTPRMRLVDVVDAEASNRASLLFELREQSSRQFALYRVIGARADQTFLTGTTQ